MKNVDKSSEWAPRIVKELNYLGHEASVRFLLEADDENYGLLRRLGIVEVVLDQNGATTEPDYSSLVLGGGVLSESGMHVENGINGLASPSEEFQRFKDTIS